MSKNGMATYDRTVNYVNLTHLPNPKKEYTINFEKLTGGLNLYDPDYRLKLNESPDMENMLWKNGTLCSRYGQNYTYVPDTLVHMYTHSCFQELFCDWAFFHIDDKLCCDIPSDDMTLSGAHVIADLDSISFYGNSYVYSRGTWLRYGEKLYFKAVGVFVEITYTGVGTVPFTATKVDANPYTPITYINANWQNGSGDSYQPENRLNPKKTIWYNAGTEEKVKLLSGNGSTTSFTFTQAGAAYVTDVTVNGLSVGNYDVTITNAATNNVTVKFYTSPNTWNVSNGDLHLQSAPPSGTNNISVTMQCAVKTYYLPVKDSHTTITSITVDGTATSAYTFNAAAGLITFTNAPPVTQPLSNNTVRVTYSLANTDAYNSIMDCPYAAVFGGNQNICMVVGGCKAQPNAFFWNGNNVAMDITYWPMEQYNLGGDTEDAITGFGRQQGQLVVFKNRSVGKVSMDLTTVENKSDTTNRVYIEMDYTQINSRIGCDLPWTIQLIDNNLVFCNSSQGVHYIKDSSSAYENNIICVSTKVNGDNGRVGLLERVRGANIVSSFDDDKRYWLIADDKVFCWDYELSEAKDPSWFYLTGIDAPALLMAVDTIYHVDSYGRVVMFDNSYADFGDGYERRYQFSTQYFGSYERLKTITDMIFTLRTDTDFRVRVTYKTDYETRDDLSGYGSWEEATNPPEPDDKASIASRSWRLVPRNLRWRDLSVYPFAYVARRRPGCRHVRHFTAILRCTGAGYDMPLLSAQVMYKYEGRDR